MQRLHVILATVAYGSIRYGSNGNYVSAVTILRLRDYATDPYFFIPFDTCSRMDCEKEEEIRVDRIASDSINS